MDVSIIIVNYNTFRLTSNCIRSVIQFTSGIQYQVILVDNASSEFDPARFLEEFPQIVLIKSTINGGFAYGNNLGIKQAQGEYILLLNSDTILQENTIAKSLRHLRNYKNGGVVGCRMTYPNGRVQHTARRFRTIKWELLDLFRFIPLLMSYKKRSRLMLGKYFKCDVNIECDWLNGAFFMFNKAILEQLPDRQLDNRFFMYGEDQLWCEQIKKLGYENIFYSETTIVHLNRGSTDPKKQLLLQRIMMKRELEIMKLRIGKNLYYYIFSMIFSIKQLIQYLIKLFVFKLTKTAVK